MFVLPIYWFTFIFATYSVERCEKHKMSWIKRIHRVVGKFSYLLTWHMLLPEITIICLKYLIAIANMISLFKIFHNIMENC